MNSNQEFKNKKKLLPMYGSAPLTHRDSIIEQRFPKDNYVQDFIDMNLLKNCQNCHGIHSRNEGWEEKHVQEGNLTASLHGEYPSESTGPQWCSCPTKSRVIIKKNVTSLNVIKKGENLQRFTGNYEIEGRIFKRATCFQKHAQSFMKLLEYKGKFTRKEFSMEIFGLWNIYHSLETKSKRPKRTKLR